MDLLSKIETTIRHDLKVDEQLDALKTFDSITEDEIVELSQHVKYSSVGILIEYLGYDRLKDHEERFIQFLQDANWPGARGASFMFVKAGEKAVPIVRKTLLNVEDDDIWLDWILCLVVEYWPIEIIEQLKDDLRELMQKKSSTESAVQALRILFEKELISKSEFEENYELLEKRFVGNKIVLAELEYLKTN